MIKATYLLTLVAITLFAFDTLGYGLKLVVYKNKQYNLTNTVYNMFSVFIKMFVTFQAPLLGVLIDVSITNKVMPIRDFRLVLFGSALGALLAILFMPTFLNLFPAIVNKVATKGSATSGLVASLAGAKKYKLKELVKLPSRSMFKDVKSLWHFKWIILANLIVQAIYSVSMYSAYLASYYRPESRLSIAGFSGTINSVASILLLVWLEPRISLLTDEVYQGKKEYVLLKRLVLVLVLTKLLGALLGQVLLVPASEIIYFTYRVLVGI